MGRAAPAVALVEENDPVRGRIEQPPHARRASAAGPAVENHRRLAARIAAGLPVDVVPVADVEHAAVVRLDLREPVHGQSVGSRRVGAPSPRRRRRLRPGRVLCRRPAARSRRRGRPHRAPAHAVGSRPARRRPRPPAAEDRLARVREDRRPARLPLSRQRRGGARSHTRRPRAAVRRGHLLVRLGRRQATRDSRRGAPRVMGGHGARRLVQRPSRLPAARLRPRVCRARGRGRQRQRRARRRTHARAHARRACADRRHRRVD